MDGYDKDIGRVAVRLHDIVTGPTEQDYAMSMNRVNRAIVHLKTFCRVLKKQHG